MPTLHVPASAPILDVGMLSSEADRFELLRSLGAGAFGAVHEARDTVSGRKVAVKLLHHLRDSGQVERHAAALIELRHPAIATHLAHGRTATGEAFLVREWLDGDSLETHLAKGPMSVSDVVQLAKALVDALSFARASGIFHLNLKPANVLLVDGRVEGAKLLDLGLPYSVRDAQLLTKSTTETACTLYLSPEQARGARAVDERSDVFSLGCLLYECVTGSAPFVGTNTLATLAKICLEDPERIDTARQGVNAKLSELVYSMLAKEAAARPGYGEIRQELERVAQSLSAPVARLSAPPEPRPSLVPPRQGRPSLRAREQQRVKCAVFVGQSAESPRELEDRLAEVLESEAARCDRLLDGSRIVTLDRQLAASEQAVAAAQLALLIRQTVSGVPIAVCTGRVLMERELPFGDLIERGALLLSETPPSMVRVDDGSAALLEARFELTHHGGQLILEAERTGGEAPRTLLGRVTPFVGRDRELAELAMLYDECVNESCTRAVLVMGPAGAGKSRLRYELVQRLKKAGPTPLLMLARGDSMRVGTQFGVLASALRTYFELGNGDALEQKREKVRAGVRRVLDTDRADSVAEFLGEVIGVHFPEESSSHLRAARRDPQLMADRVLASFLEWLEAQCQRTPVVLLVEDLHWSDPASVRFIEAALRTLSERPLFVLAFARPEVQNTFPGVWTERGLQEIRLTKLGSKACERLLEAIGGASIPATIKTQIVERAEGNPFFLEELVRGLKSTADGNSSLPDSLLGMIQARLDALGEEAKVLVRVASVFGQTFRIEGVQALLGGQVARLNLPARLKLLAAREVIFPRGAQNEGEYAFRHSLIRESAYMLLPDAERRVAHRLAGEWLEAEGAAEPALLAEHFERGGAHERAAGWYRVAATLALEANSLDDVLRCGEKAVACGGKGELLGEVASVVAEALSYKGENDSRAADWAMRARENLSPAAPAWWRASQVAAISYLRLGSMSVSAVAEAMIESTRLTPTGPEQVIALATTAADCFRQAQRDLGARILDLLPHDSTESLHGRPLGIVQSARCILAYTDGNLSAALQHAAEALNTLRHAGVVRDATYVLLISGSLQYDLGLNESAEATLKEAAKLSHRLGTEAWVLNAQQYLGLVQLRRRDLESATKTLLSTAEGYERIQLPSCAAVSLFFLASATVDIGNVERSEEYVTRALKLSGGDASARAGALAVLSKLELRRGRLRDALAAGKHCMELLREHNLWEYVALMRASHVENLLACGHDEDARTAIHEAQRWLMERAEKIDDAALRGSFLEQVPENARIQDLAKLLEGRERPPAVSRGHT